MLKELNRLAGDLLGLHGYPTRPPQWRGDAAGANVPPPRPVVPHARPPRQAVATLRAGGLAAAAGHCAS